MYRTALPLAAVFLSILPASALTPAAESLLKELGLDARSSAILAIAADSVKTESGEVYTLDGLAAKGDVAAVKAFLVTREFFHDFQANWDIEFPNDELYDIRYLTGAERVYMAKKLMEDLPVSAKVSALQPAAEAFLKELGMDSQSEQVRSVASDKVTTASGKVMTLDSLAAKRDETGVKSFIATRVFIRAFRKDSGAAFPDDERYNILYLTSDEKAYISKKLLEAFPKAKTPRG